MGWTDSGVLCHVDFGDDEGVKGSWLIVNNEQ